MEGDMVLLHNLGVKLPPEKLKSWWYGPFTIKSLCENGAVVLVDNKGGKITVNSQRLKLYHKDDEDSISGYVILRDEGT